MNRNNQLNHRPNRMMNENQLFSHTNLQSEFNSSATISPTINHNSDMQLISSNSSVNNNSTINLSSNQPIIWNYDSGIQTKMPSSKANSYTSRGDDTTSCSLSQNSNLDEMVTTSDQIIDNSKEQQAKFKQEFNNFDNLCNLNQEINSTCIQINGLSQLNKCPETNLDSKTPPIQQINRRSNNTQLNNGNTYMNPISNGSNLHSITNHNEEETILDIFESQQLQSNNNLSLNHSFRQSLNLNQINYDTINQSNQLYTSSSNSTFSNNVQSHQLSQSIRPAQFDRRIVKNHSPANLTNHSQQQVFNNCNVFKKSPTVSTPQQHHQTYQSTTVKSECDRELSPDETIKTLTEIIELLNDPDELIVCTTVQLVYKILNEEKKRRLLIDRIPLIQSLIRLADLTTDLQTLVYLSRIFNDFSQSRQELQIIFQNNILPILYKLLNTHTDRQIVNHSIMTLHNILLKQDGATRSVAHKTNGITTLIYLLNTNNNSKFLTIVVDCLHLSAYKNQEVKQIILQNGGPQRLIQIMNACDYDKLLLNTTRLMKVISVCEKNKKILVQSGGMQALTKNLDHDNMRIVCNSLWTLRNLSDAAFHQRNIEELLQKLVQMLTSEHVNIRICVAGILANLTCDNKYNKQIVFKLEGLTILMQTIVKAGDQEDILEPTLCALRHLTCRHDDAENCQKMMRAYLEPIIRLLHSPSKWPMIKGCINLIRNLALLQSNIQPLREEGVIHRLFQLLSKTCQEIKHIWSISQNATNMMDADGLQMYQIIEAILATFKIISTDEFCLKIMINSDLIHYCFNIICYPMPDIQRIALNCLNRSIDLQPGLDKIEKEDHSILQNLSSSSDELVRNEASKILDRLSKCLNMYLFDG